MYQRMTEDNKSSNPNRLISNPFEAHDRMRILNVGLVGDGLSQYLMEYLARHALNNPNAPINIVFRSPGGDIYEMLSCIDSINNGKALLSEGVPIRGIVHGYAMSAGSALLMYCDHRVITESSYLMLHGMTQSMRGVDDEWIRAHAKFLDGVRATMVNAYEKRSNLSRDKVIDILRRNTPTYFNAREALEAGLVDEIVPSRLPFVDSGDIMVEPEHGGAGQLEREDPWERLRSAEG